MTDQQIVQQIKEKYSEYFEMIKEEDHPHALVGILARMYLKERNMIDYYKRRLNFKS